RVRRPESRGEGTNEFLRGCESQRRFPGRRHPTAECRSDNRARGGTGGPTGRSASRGPSGGARKAPGTGQGSGQGARQGSGQEEVGVFFSSSETPSSSH